MMDLALKWVVKLSDNHRQRLSSAVISIFCFFLALTALALVGNLIAFNLPASLNCTGTRSYTNVEQSQPEQPNYAILGQGSLAGSNADLHLTDKYERDFCQSEFYVCRDRPINCNESILSEVARSRVTLSSFTTLQLSRSISYLFQQILAITWGGIYNIGLFIWFVFNIPAGFSFITWSLLSIGAYFIFLPIMAAINGLEAAQTKLALQPLPPLSQIGRESAQGDATVASAEQVGLVLTRQPGDFANDMTFED
jgi:hypothetical protein